MLGDIFKVERPLMIQEIDCSPQFLTGTDDLDPDHLLQHDASCRPS